jgi:predicted nucleic acid-binding protein
VKKYDLHWCEPIRIEVVEKAIAKQISAKRIISLFADLYLLAKEVDLSSVVVQRIVAQDRDDDFILACALESQSHYLVTYDPHILNLGPMFRGIKILDGLHFLYVLRGDKPPG